MKKGTLYYVFKYMTLGSKIKLFFSKSFSLNHCFILTGRIKSMTELPDLRPPKGDFRKMEISDLDELEGRIKDLDQDDRKELITRILFYKSGFENCYLFILNNKIAYMQWVVYPTENYLMEEKYKYMYHKLGEKEVMIENVFVFPEFRGWGLVQYVTKKILKIALDEGFTKASCYIRKKDIISLNEFVRMGCKFNKMVGDYKFLGKSWRTLNKNG